MNRQQQQDDTLGRYLAAAFIAHRLGIKLDYAYKRYVKDAELHESWIALGEVIQKHQTQRIGQRLGALFTSESKATQ